MNKIYSAIGEQELLGLANILIKKIPDSELSYITTSEELWEAINSSFQMIIAPIQLIEIEKLKTLSHSGTVILIDSSIEKPYSVKDSVHIYNNIQSFKDEILLKDLVNKDIKKNTKIAPPTKIETQAKSKLAENDAPKSMENEKPKESKKPIQDIGIKSTAHNYTTTELPEGDEFFSRPVDMEDYPKKISVNSTQKRKRYLEIIQANFMYDKSDKNKRIGVWSPLPVNGVTTFIINLAIFLKQNYDLHVAVLESSTSRPRLKSILTKYDKVPPDWHSYIEIDTNYDLKPASIQWRYRGVDWVPLKNKDFEENWTPENVDEYLQLIKNANVGFVDLPSGQMEIYTLYAMQYLDELWIMVDHRHDLTKEWLNYINDIIENYSLNVKLIVTRCPKSAKAAKEIVNHSGGYPLLCALPSLDSEIIEADWDDTPLIDTQIAKEILTPIFEDIADYVLNEKDLYKLNIWKKIKRIFSHG